MRILFIAKELPYPENSGGKKYIWQKIRQLSKNNEVILVALNEFNEIVHSDIYKKYVKEYYFFPRVRSKLKIISNFWKPYSMISREGQCIKNKIRKIVLNDKIDLIFLDSIHMYTNIDKIDINRIPVLLTQHNIEYELFAAMGKDSNNIFKKIIYNIEASKLKRLEKKLYSQKFFKGYVFISDLDYKKYKETIGDVNAICMPPCVEQEYDGFHKNIEKKSIVFTGTMSYEHNINAMKWFIKKIFPIVLKKVPESKLYVVGKSPTDDLIKLSSDSVIITGVVEDVKEYLSKAQIIVIPLLNGGGVKLKLFEALGTNNIVITTTIGTEGTCFKDNVDLFISDDAESFAARCVDNLIQPNYEIAKNGNKTLRENYIFETLESKLNEFMQRVRS